MTQTIDQAREKVAGTRAAKAAAWRAVGNAKRGQYRAATRTFEAAEQAHDFALADFERAVRAANPGMTEAEIQTIARTA